MTSGLLRKDLRYAPLWLAVALLLLGLMLMISVSAPMMDAMQDVIDDWVLHILGFMVIAVAFCGPLQPRFHNRVFVAFLACGVLIELIQLAIPGRSASLVDMIANLVGLALAWYVLASKYGDWCLRLETRLGIQ